MFTHWSGSNYSHGEGSTHGECWTEGWSDSTGTSHSTSISIGPSAKSISFHAPSRHIAATASPRVRQAAAPVERQLRLLAQRLTLAEFHALRVRLEDFFDECLLNGV